MKERDAAFQEAHMWRVELGKAREQAVIQEATGPNLVPSWIGNGNEAPLGRLLALVEFSPLNRTRLSHPDLRANLGPS